MWIFPQACTSVLSFLISICSYVCVCFPQNCRVQTVLQTSYESWGFWLHRVGTVRGKQRKTDQKKQESICFHPKPSRGELRPATLGKTAATHTEQIHWMFQKTTKAQGVITDNYKDISMKINQSKMFLSWMGTHLMPHTQASPCCHTSISSSIQIQEGVAFT